MLGHHIELEVRWLSRVISSLNSGKEVMKHTGG